nr:hypothetical protein [Tanacetum cinerariifolium]
MPEAFQKPDAIKMTIDQFTEHLAKTTSFIFSPTPPREPTPPRDESKGKDEQLTNENIMAQVKEMNRLADLKAEKEISDESFRKMLNPAIVRAQTQKMAEYEAKRAKMLKEYNDCINQRANELAIMKISYRISSSTMQR